MDNKHSLKTTALVRKIGTLISITLASAIYLTASGFSQHAAAAESNSTSNVVIETDMLTAALAPSGDLIHRRLEFLASEVDPALPPDIRAALHSHLLHIRIKQGLDRAGLFAAAEDGSLEIDLGPQVFAGADAEQVLAHEYFHAAHFSIHPDEPAWLREGLAQVFESVALNGRFNKTNFEAGFEDLKTPLMGRFDVDSPEVNPAQYGHDLLYIYYLTRQCGGEDLFWKIARSALGVFGTRTIDRALEAARAQSQEVATREQCGSFQASATHFEIARIINHANDSSSNSQIHLIRSPALPNPPENPPFSQSSLQSFRDELPKLELYEPVLFQVGGGILPPAFPGAEVFWLQTSYPYHVQNTPPVPSDPEWSMLILKH